MAYSSKTRSRTVRRTRKMSKKNKRINDFYQIQKMRIEDVYHFGRFTKLQYFARQRAQFQQEVAAYLAAKELASRQISGYLTTGNMGRHDPQSRNYRRTYDDYVISRNTDPRYSEPEIPTNPWYISGIGEWDQLYGDLSA